MQETPIRGDILKRAFDNLDVLGPAVKESIIEHIERQGVVLDSKHYHTLEEIEKLLSSIFGGAATELLVERLRRGTHVLKSSVNIAAPVAGLFLLQFLMHPA
jgi:hypothetical protein